MSRVGRRGGREVVLPPFSVSQPSSRPCSKMGDLPLSKNFLTAFRPLVSKTKPARTASSPVSVDRDLMKNSSTTLHSGG